MKRSAFLFALLSAMTALADPPNHQPEAVTIPLDQIWGYELPGTKDIRELEPKLDVHDPGFRELYERSIVRKIARYLATYVPRQGEIADPGFVVVGTGKEALEIAYEILRDRERKYAERVLPKDTELTLVFYTFTTDWHPRIESVEQSPDSMTVKYRFIAPEEPSFAAKRFALIPIGKLKAGTVHVEIEELLPVDFRGLSVPPKLDSERFVCDSFSFEVK